MKSDSMSENKVVRDYVKEMLSHLTPKTLAGLLADLGAAEFDDDLQQEIWEMGAYLEGWDGFSALYEAA
jgi:hypothetical protein